MMRVKGAPLLAFSLLAGVLTGCTPTDEGISAAKQPEALAPAITAPQTTPATPQPSATDQAAADQKRRVEQLIRSVEASYNRGEANYRRGRLPEAKLEFDRAVDLMLQSALDIRSNQQLSEEFDKVLDGVNSLEMEVLKKGNGFVAPVEPTVADVANEVTFEVDPNFVARARADLATTKSDLPLVMNEYVAAYVNFFANTTRGHYTLLHSFQRSGRYMAMIQRVLAEEGVPQDLIYLAVAESSFNPRALNGKSGAGGMWQFMPHGNYGLARTAYVDERFDPEKSTRAYARYMKFIYAQLGDWYLSMAGYNWGSLNVQKAVQKTGYSDYWELYRRNNLPAETKAYVPEILAAIIVANHPTQYGFDDIPLDPPLLTDTVTINYSVDMRLVSDIVGAPLEEMQALNPSLLRGITPPDASFDLHLPAGTGTLFNKSIELVPESKRTAWRFHRVKEGDTLASIARDMRVGVSELADANNVEADASLSGVEAVVVPSAPSAASRRATSTAIATASTAAFTTYTTHKGDTLVTIADRFGVSLDQLRKMNNLTGTKVEAGRKLRIAESSSATRGSRSHRSSSRGGQEAKGATANAKSSHATQGSKSTHGHGATSSTAHKESAKPASTAKKSGSASSSKHTSSKGKNKTKQ